MLVAFDQLPDSSRLWVYQSNRAFTSLEEEKIFNTVKDFCERWEAHGHTLSASFKIEYHQFIVLAVDENVNEASGCSIDGCVRILKEIQNQNNLDLFDRSIAFLISDSVVIHSSAEAKTLLSSGQISEGAIIFNNAVSSKNDFLKDWKITAQNSWLAKYLPKKTLV